MDEKHYNRGFLFRNRKFKNKLFVSYISISLAALVVFGIVTYLNSINIYKNEMYEKSAQVTSLVNKTLDENFKSMVNLTDMLYSKTDTNLNQLTELLSNPSLELWSAKINLNWELKKYYNEINSMRNDFIGLYIRGMNGYIYNDFVHGNEKSYSEVDDWYDRTLSMKGTPIFWGTHRQFYSDTGYPVISLSKLITDKASGNYIAVVLMDFNLTMLDEICRDISQAPGSNLIISDENSNIIYDSTKKLMMTKLDTSIANAFNGEKNGKSIIKLYDIDCLVTFSTSNLSGWKVTSVIPVSSLLNRWHFIGYTALVVCLGLLLILSVVSYFISKSITKPIQTLLSLMKKIEEGDFTVKAESIANDEIGQLNQGFTRMVRRLKELIDREYKAKASQKEAELKALLAQINPHFLYNTLEQISAISIIKKVPEIDSISIALANMLRYSIKPNNIVTLRNELKHVDDYFKIISFDTENKIKIIYNIPEECLEYRVLKLSLQPLIENSVIHGFEKFGLGGKIVVSAVIQDNMLLIKIEDNGSGMDEYRLSEVKAMLATNESDQQEIKESSVSIGLKNVNSRLILFYGCDYGLLINSSYNQGTIVVVRLPATRLED